MRVYALPLKSRLIIAIKRIDLQIQRLEKARNRFSERDKSLFARIVKAYTKHDMVRANIFASELAEIRKMEKMIVHSQLALQQIVLRLKTVSELGDVVSTLTPAVRVLRSIRTGIAAVSPEVEREFGHIGNILNGIITDAGYSTGLSIDFKTANEDAQKILKEAATVAEQKVKEQFPELPTRVSPANESVPTKT